MFPILQSPHDVALIFRTCQLHTTWEVLHEYGGSERPTACHAFRGIAHTPTVCACSSALTPSSVRSALAGPRDLKGHQDTAYNKSATHSLKHGLAQAADSSCLYSDPSFICTVCTDHG